MIWKYGWTQKERSRAFRLVEGINETMRHIHPKKKSQ